MDEQRNPFLDHTLHFQYHPKSELGLDSVKFQKTPHAIVLNNCQEKGPEKIGT